MSTPTAKTTKAASSKKMLKKSVKVKEEEPEVAAPQVVDRKNKDVDAPAKKAKKAAVQAESAEAAPAKKSKASKQKDEASAEEPKKAKKGAKAKKEKESDAPQEEEEKKVKKVKKINNKPTLSDTCGLNLSVAKVKNIMSNLCINSEPFWALKELKEHRNMAEEKLDSEGKSVREVAENGKKVKRAFTFTLHGLSQHTLDYLELAHQNSLDLSREAHAKLKIKEMSEEVRKEYNLKKKEAIAVHQLVQKNGHLFQVHEFNAVKFNNEWNKNFYKDMKVTEWKSLKDMELYTYCTNLINKMKVRFNAESKIFVTAFVEHIVQQMVVNGTINCVTSGKKIIKLEHALDSSAEGFEERFSLFPLISNLESFKRALREEEDSEETEPEEKQEEPMNDEEVVDRKYQFKYYVSELCRTVKMELARADCSEDMTQSVYYNTSVSKVFKNFCSNIIVDLIRTFGEVLKVEVNTRNVKTVNYTIIQTLVQVAHLMYGLGSQLDDTVRFIQERYCVYQKFIEERKGKRGKHDDDDDEDEEDEL